MKRQLLAMAAATTAIPTIAAATTLETFTLTMEVISATGPARDPDGLNPDPFCRDDEVAVGTTETISGVSFSFVPTEAGATSGTGSLTESGETLSGPSTFCAARASMIDLSSWITATAIRSPKRFLDSLHPLLKPFQHAIAATPSLRLPARPLMNDR